MSDLKPNNAEQAFLLLGYNRFLDLYEEIEAEFFWEQPPIYRFHRIRDVFAIYAELIQYEPLKHILDSKKASRPEEHAVADLLFMFVRNLLAHFPLFDSWDAVRIDQQLATWERQGQIHKFLKSCSVRKQLKYRFFDPIAKEMMHATIEFPGNYLANQTILLNSILTERDGVRFSMRLMLQILIVNVETPDAILAELQVR